MMESLRLIFMLSFVTFLVKGDMDVAKTIGRLQLAHELMRRDISNFDKLWISLMIKLDNLETELEIIEKNKVYNIVNGNTNASLSSHEKLNDNLHNTTMATVHLLLKGFKDEKLKVKSLNKLLQNSLRDIEGLTKRISDHDGQFTDLRAHMSLLDEFKDKDEQFNENIRKDFADLVKSNYDLSQDFTILNKTLYANNCENENTLRKPTFVSEWILIRSQDQKFGQKTIPHGLGEIPYKVDVQVRPTFGSNSGWIFSGDSAMQSDDDLKDEVYGGVVYFYDSSNIYIITPLKTNNFAVGRVLNTGENKNRRLGNNHQASNEAYVRVKVWSPVDFPKPDIESEWFPLDTDNPSRAYHELTHGLNEYPGLVNVQTRSTSKNGENVVIFEGVGTSTSYREWLNYGGVVHAFDKNYVRVWVAHHDAYLSNSIISILGGLDGWNRQLLNDIDRSKGQFRVLVWNRSKLVSSRRNSKFEQIEENVNFPEWSPFDKFSPETDLLSFYVQANDGLNKGFRFPGSGNSQSTGPSSFGGVMYAYNSNGDIRIWRPNPSIDGYMIHVYEPFGNGNNHQRSNNASFVSTLLRTNECN
ncbi:hypothetical protein ACF0H5_014686 [Mactra antiquata]